MRRSITTLAVVAALSLGGGAGSATAASGTSSPSTPTSAESASPASTSGPSASKKKLKKRYATFQGKRYRGTGDKVIKLPKRARQGLVTIKAPGTGWIKAQLMDADGKRVGRPLAGKRDLPYRGTTVYGIRSSSERQARYIAIETRSNKQWRVRVHPIHTAKKLKKKQKGSQDAVFRFTAKKSKRWSVNYRSDRKSNLIVTTYGKNRNQVVWNEIVQRYKHKNVVGKFSGLVEIRSYGKWTIKR